MKVLKIFLILLSITVAQISNGQSVQIGHRNSGVPVLDVTVATFTPQVTSTLAASGFTLFSINNLLLDDVISDPTYYKNLSLEIEFTDAAGVHYTGSYYFTLAYDEGLNKYYLDETGGPLGVPNGGKVTCSAENCMGCKPYKGEKGQPNGCSNCTGKVDPSSSSGPNCNQGGTSGGGNGPAWTKAIGDLLIELFKLFK